MTRVQQSPALITATPAWRMRAIQLAAERNMLGQARRSRKRNEYTCISASEPDDHVLQFNPLSGTIVCDCKAGQQVQPCAHAGSTLLLIVGCATERVRDAEGFTRE